MSTPNSVNRRGVTAASGSAAGGSIYLKELPEGFEMSAEESNLQKMYSAMKNFETAARKEKEKRARDKIFKNRPLAANDDDDADADADDDHIGKDVDVVVKDELMDDELSTVTSAAGVTDPANANIKRRPGKKKTKIRIKKELGEDDEDGSDGDLGSDDDGSDDEDKAKASAGERRLAAMRRENKKKRAAMEDTDAAKQEELRNQLLATNDESIMDQGPALKKVRRNDDTAAVGPSILDGLQVTQTPLHEFSEKLELFDWKGKVIFPTYEGEEPWVPPERVTSPNDGAFLAELPDFDINQASNGQGNNTIAIKFVAPVESKRFSVNIAAPGQKDMESILFHFNPRARGKSGGNLVVNDKQEGVWGRPVTLPLTQVPLMFGQESVTMIVQINGDGFDVFIEGKHCVRLEHRTELPSKPCSLWLQFPSSDDSLKRENWTVLKTWWGNKDSMVDETTLSRVAGYQAFDSVHPRKLFLSGLQKIRTEREKEIRQAEIERTFRAFGGNTGVQTLIPLNQSYAFVIFESERMCDEALRLLPDKLPYKIGRARRSKHEFLQEKREADALAAQGIKKSSGDW